jgi:hypothetical protein
VICFGGGIVLSQIGTAIGLNDTVSLLGYAPATLTVLVHRNSLH